jgi:hypothetical protein
MAKRFVRNLAIGDIDMQELDVDKDVSFDPVKNCLCLNRTLEFDVAELQDALTSLEETKLYTERMIAKITAILAKR